MLLPSTFGQDPRGRGILGLLLLQRLMQAHQGRIGSVPSNIEPSRAIDIGGSRGISPFAASGIGLRGLQGLARFFPSIHTAPLAAPAIATPAQAGLRGAEEAFTGASTVGTSGTTGITSGIETGLVGAEEAVPGISTAGASSTAAASTAASGGNLVLPGIGAAAGLGMSIANLVKGNIPAGAGGLGGGAAGAGIGFALGGPPGALLGFGLGSGAGGFLGSLFGGGGPSEAWRSFGPRLAEGLPKMIGASTTLVQDVINAPSEEALSRAITAARQKVEASGHGGFTTLPSPDPWGVGERFAWPGIAGATGTSHEGGISFWPDALNDQVRYAIQTKLRFLRGQAPMSDFPEWADRMMRNTEATLVKGRGGQVEDSATAPPEASRLSRRLLRHGHLS